MRERRWYLSEGPIPTDFCRTETSVRAWCEPRTPVRSGPPTAESEAVSELDPGRPLGTASYGNSSVAHAVLYVTFREVIMHVACGDGCMTEGHGELVDFIHDIANGVEA